MTEDAELLRRYVAEHSEEAFAELVRRHLGLVYACALRRVGGDAHLAQDVTQQVFTDVARRAAHLARRPVLAGWLFTSARYAAAKAMRSARRRLQREQEVLLMEDISRDTDELLDWGKARPLLDDALGELSEGDREAILLRYFEAREYPSIGAALHLTNNAARMRVERALAKLRTKLGNRGVTSTAAAIATALAQQTAVALPSGLAAHVTTTALAAGGLATGAASAVASGGALLLTNKLQLAAMSALIVATGTGFVIQSQHNTALRSEVEQLRQHNRQLTEAQAQRERRSAAAAAEFAALQSDAAELARLRDQAAALQATIGRAEQATAARRADATTTYMRPTLTAHIADALRRIKPLQDAKDWAGMQSLIDSLIPQVEPTSYDMALLLDLKAKLYLQQERMRDAIEPWEQVLKLSNQFGYFDAKTRHDIDNYLAQLRFSAGLTKTMPPLPWF